MMPLVFAAVLAVGLQLPTASCAVTTPLAPGFLPPAPFAELSGDRSFWFGTPALWTRLPRDGRSMPRDKSFWWSPEYSRTHEPQPDLRVTATSLTTGATAVMRRATNAQAADLGGWTMLTMLEFPASGCWSVTATYRGQAVTFV